MIGGMEAGDFLWGNLKGLESAIEEGNQDLADLSRRGYFSGMNEYRDLLSKSEREKLEEEYGRINQGN